MLAAFLNMLSWTPQSSNYEKPEMPLVESSILKHSDIFRCLKTVIDAKPVRIENTSENHLYTHDKCIVY